eukprot:746948-Hanusia_phi.AAC.4
MITRITSPIASKRYGIPDVDGSLNNSNESGQNHTPETNGFNWKQVDTSQKSSATSRGLSSEIERRKKFFFDSDDEPPTPQKIAEPPSETPKTFKAQRKQDRRKQASELWGEDDDDNHELDFKNDLSPISTGANGKSARTLSRQPNSETKQEGSVHEISFSWRQRSPIRGPGTPKSRSDQPYVVRPARRSQLHDSDSSDSDVPSTKHENSKILNDSMSNSLFSSSDKQQQRTYSRHNSSKSHHVLDKSFSPPKLNSFSKGAQTHLSAELMAMKEQIVKQQEYFAKYQKRINEEIKDLRLTIVDLQSAKDGEVLALFCIQTSPQIAI